MEFLAGPCEHCESIRHESHLSSGREKLTPLPAELAGLEGGLDRGHKRHK